MVDKKKTYRLVLGQEEMRCLKSWAAIKGLTIRDFILRACIGQAAKDGLK